MTIPVAIVGVGKIARDQHLPAIAANPDFELVAAVSRNETVAGVPNFTDFDRFLAEGPAGAVALCTPPAVRTAMTLKAIAAGRDVMIEKPPAATMSEAETIIAAAQNAGVTLFATWHSRYAPAVDTAREWIAGRVVESIRIDWREDVRRWHPNQDWIWQPGGFGVLDPGINALSVLTEIFPGPIHVTEATLEVPANAFTPIAADIAMTGPDAVPIRAVFDWRQEGPQTWDIAVQTEGGLLELHMGGARLAINGEDVATPPEAEYPGLYRRFAELITTRSSDADMSPLRLCADTWMLARHIATEPFFD